MALCNVTQAEILPSSGEFEGEYHRDRWGVGRFGYWLVSPELHDRLQEFENRRVRLQVLKAEQPWNPGPGIIRSIGEVKVLEQSPLDFELRTDVQWNRNQRELETTFFLVNNTSGPIDVSLHDVVLRIYSETKPDDAAKRDYWFEEYTRGQLRTKTETLQWLNNRIALANMSFEHGHHLRIQSKQRFPIVARFPSSPGQHELRFEGRPFVGEVWKSPQEAWFPVTVSDVKPTNHTKTSKLTVKNVQWKMSENPFRVPVLRLSFTLSRPPHEDRSVAVCNQRGRVLMAGTIAGVDEQGNVRKLEIDPCYDCSSRGEPWELKQIPNDGFSTAIDIRERQVLRGQSKLQQARLELLTDEGLESFTVPGPPSAIIPSDQAPKK